MGGEKGRVCVTGGTGFVGSWLIKTLLQNGYSVNAPIRYPRPEHKKDISYLSSLPGASEHLTIFPANLNQPDSFAPAIQGCIGVFHLATELRNPEPDEAITKLNVDALLGILKASLDSKTVRRVVYTSSAAAVLNNREAGVQPVGNGETVNPMTLDEGSWSDIEYIKETMPETPKRSYVIQKTLTERAALEFGEREGLEVVTVVTSNVAGCFLTPWLPGSIILPLSPLFENGNADHRLFNIKMVHVDDLARAFIFLLESPTAKGRYIVTSYHGQLLEICNYMANRYPDLYKKKTESELKAIKGAVPPSLSAKKLLDAGFKFKHGREDIFDDAVKSCKEKGIL